MAERRLQASFHSCLPFILTWYFLDWLDEKLVSTKFAFPALYWHTSKMPLEIWKACPSTTNGNEQSHRNVNRDGVGLTLLAGVMRGMHYDKRAFEGIEGIVQTGVLIRDTIATHHFRKLRSVIRTGNYFLRFAGWLLTLSIRS